MKILFMHISNNSNGHPRVVCHFLSLNTEYEKSNEFWNIHGINTIQRQYDAALARSRRIGGKKYHNRQYGGGIAFTITSRDEEQLESQIKAAIEADEPRQ